MEETSLTSEQLFTRIVTGQAIIEKDDGDFFVVKDPTVQERQLAEAFYQQSLQALLATGIPAQSDLLQKQRSEGLWGDVEEMRLLVIPEEIQRARDELVKCQFRSITRSALLNRIDKLQKETKTLHAKQENLSRFSAEYIANIIKHKYLVYRLSYDLDGRKLWEGRSFQTFLGEAEEIANQVISHGFYPKNIDESAIRKLARSEVWKSVWIGAQKTGNLFGKPLIEITDLQRVLLSWSLIYDSALESMDSPDREIFDDDEEFDKWLLEQSAKRREEKPPEIPKGHSPKFIEKADRTEVGIMVESAEDAAKVYAMNSPQSTKIIKERERLSKGKNAPVKEGDMPDSQQIIRQKLTAMEMDRFK